MEGAAGSDGVPATPLADWAVQFNSNFYAQAIKSQHPKPLPNSPHIILNCSTSLPLRRKDRKEC
eukprot:259357-Amorphochlora_amoeboformis.AAC.2